MKSALARKIKADQALNMSELAIASGYSRDSIKAMDLPWNHGRIFYTDFRRIMRARQAKHERALLKPESRTLNPSAAFVTASSLAPASDDSMRAIADRFRAPKSMNGHKAASRARAPRQPRSTA